MTAPLYDRLVPTTTSTMLPATASPSRTGGKGMVCRLASTRSVLMMLCAGARMAIFLVLVRWTLWAGIAHDHRWWLAPAVVGLMQEPIKEVDKLQL
jgi:hypothetical protein